MADQELHAEIELLKRRVAALEAAAKAAQAPLAELRPVDTPRSAEPPELPPVTELLVEHLPEVDLPQIPATAPPTSPPTRPTAPPLPAEALARVTPPPLPARAQSLFSAPRTARNESALRERVTDLERLIGGRWYAVLGALAVTIAVGLFVHLAYKEGWLRVPPGVRCAGGALFGFVLIVVAEFLRKKVNARAAVGAYAAGLGSIYVSVYAAWRLYEILPPAWCFTLLAATAVLGVAVGLRSKLAAVSVAGLIGGYAAPLLMSAAPSSAWVLPVYVLFLAMIGLVVSWYKGKGFHAVRLVTWLGTITLGWLWTAGYTSAAWIELSFLLVAWCLLQGELILSTRRGVWAGVGPVGRIYEGLALVGTMLLSGWFALLCTFAVKNTPIAEWLPTLMGAGMCLGGALLACGSPSVILDSPRTASERLGSCLMLQAGSMMIVATALALSGPAQAIAWIAMALATVLAGWRTNLLGVRLYAFALLVIGTARLMGFDAWRTSMGVSTYTVAGLHLTLWAGLMAAAAGTWAMTALIGVGQRTPPFARRALAVITGIVLFASSVHLKHLSVSQVALWLVMSATALGLSLNPRFPKIGNALRVYAWALLAVITGRLVLLDSWSTAMDMASSRIMGLHITAWSVLMAATAALWAAAAMFGLGKNSPVQIRIALGAIASLVLFGATVHTQHVGASQATLWLVLSAAALLAGTFERSSWASTVLSSFAKAVLCVLTLRLVLHDSEHTAMGVATRDVMGLHLTAWAGLMLASAALWLTIARLSLSEQRHRIAAMAVGVLACLLLLGASAHEANAPRSQMVVWLALLTLLGGARPLVRSARPDLAAGAGLLAPLVLWIISEGGDRWPVGHAALLYPGFLIGLLLTGAIALAGWWVRRAGDAWAPRAVFGATIAAVAMFFVASSLEAARAVQQVVSDETARRAAVSMWWGLFAAGLLTIGFLRTRALARHAGLALLGLAGAKVVIYDLADVSQVWRIASFLALGLMMIGVAVVYAKVTRGRLTPGDESMVK